MRNSLLKLRRSVLTVGMSAAMLLTGAGNALAVTTIGTNISTDGTLTVVGNSTFGTVVAGTWNGTAVAVANGGTGATDAATARTNLGLGTAATMASGAFATAAQGALADTAVQPAGLAGYLLSATAATTYQPLDSDLTAIAALTTTAYGRGMLELLNAAAGQTALGLVIGTNVQAWDSDLDSWSAVATSAKAASGANSDITSLGAVTSIDNAGVGLNVGGTNATSITIGRNGVGASFPGGMGGYSLSVGMGGISLMSQNYSAAGTDDTTAEWDGSPVVFLTNAGTQTFNLGACASNGNRIVTVYVKDQTANARIINGTNAEGVWYAGATSNLSMQNNAGSDTYAATLYCDGTDWIILNRMTR